MKPRIAVVEDNLDNRLLVQAILEEDYEISEYESGLEVVDGLADDIPDLVLLDISLPGMDGTEVLEWPQRLPHRDGPFFHHPEREG